MNLTVAQWLSPWEVSPTLILIFILCGALYIRGTRKHKVNAVRQSLFWVGFVMLYLALHTHVDYFAERVFFVHRTQHVVLHHLAPLIVMASYPGQVLRSGLPKSIRQWLYHFKQSTVGIYVQYWLTHRYFIPFLFVFLVLIWLPPTIQFYSMLDWRIYRFMNWSVVFSGFLYWNLILDRRPWVPPTKTVGHGFWAIHPSRLAVMKPVARVLSPIFTMLPQMVAGALIAFANVDLFPLFDLCGRALPITALEDQMLGGIIMWVPAAVVETFGLLAALATCVRLSAKYSDRRLAVGVV